MKTTPLQELLEKYLQDPEFSEAYAEERIQSQISRSIVLSRKEKKLRQSDLETLTGIKQSEISKIENGLVYPNLSTLAKIFTALDLELFSIPSHRLYSSKVKD